MVIMYKNKAVVPGKRKNVGKHNKGGDITKINVHIIRINKTTAELKVLLAVSFAKEQN